MNKNIFNIILIFGTIFILLCSSVIPSVISNNVDNNIKVSFSEKITFTYYDKYNSSNIEYEDIDITQKRIIENFASEQNISFYKSPQITLANGPIDSAWPMKCHDNHHTSRSPYNTENVTDREMWRFETDGWIDGGISIDKEGTIYFGGSFNELPYYLHAVYSNDTSKWAYRTGGLICSCPAIDDNGIIYIGSYDNFLHAVYPNGTRKWTFHASDAITSSPAIGTDGTIYFGVMGPGSDAGRIFAVNPDGTEKWHYDTGFWITSDPAIGDDGTIYIGSGDNYLYALYPNGTLRWRFKTGHYVKGPPSIADDGTIYIGSYDDYLYAVNPNGTEKWRYPVGSGTETNPSIAKDGTVYVGDDKLYAIYPNGTLRWDFDLGEDRYVHQSSPAISSEGTIYVGTKIGSHDGGEIIAVNPDGSEKWRKMIALDWVQSSPCISKDGVVYIGSSSVEGNTIFGYLHAFGEGEENNPPNKPTITGETDGKFGVEYEYTFSAIDPNGDDVCYYVEWRDGEITDWTDAYESGEDVVLSHTWDERGTYIIRARAKDTDNLWGPWGELEVTMPVNQQSSDSLFHWFLERFPNAFPILRNILGR